MRATKITIKNFRSLKEVEIVPDNFNIFIGQNNHGKTNAFEAVQWFFEGIKRVKLLKKFALEEPEVMKFLLRFCVCWRKGWRRKNEKSD